MTKYNNFVLNISRVT